MYKGTIRIDRDRKLTDTELAVQIANALEVVKARDISVQGNRIHFVGGFLRGSIFMNNWNVLIPFGRGEIEIDSRRSEIRYQLSFMQLFVIATAIACFFAFFVMQGTKAPPWPVIPFIWVWLFGGNLAIGIPRFHTFLKRAISSPKDGSGKRFANISGEELPPASSVVKMAYYVAIAGLIASMIVHLMAVSGTNPQQVFPPVWVLHVIIFPPFFIMIFSNRPFGYGYQGNPWRLLQNAPRWMISITVVFFAYALINFANFFYTGVSQWGGGSPSIINGKKVLSNHGSIVRTLSDEEYDRCLTEVFRGFSGHWMAFYAIAMAGLCSRIRVGRRKEPA